jgi:hypothetical protein
VAKVLFALLLEPLLELRAFCSLALCLPGRDVLTFVVVDVPSDFEVEISLSGC